MKNSRAIVGIAVAVIVIALVALWPTFVGNGTSAARAESYPTAVPVTADYLERDKDVALWERATKQNFRQDMLSPRQLAGQYLQRYRERGDIGDVMRARANALLSLKRMPYGNMSADMELASVELTLHEFHAALARTKFVEGYDPRDPQMHIREASLDLEIGDYAAAKRLIDGLPHFERFEGIPKDVLVTRYDELTGHLAEARDLFERPLAFGNASFGAGAQSRAWYYFRKGELDFESGHNDEAVADEQAARTIFPHDVDAGRAQARFLCAMHRWQPCLDAAIDSANVIPYPETLGYEADAQRALGENDAAKQTDDLIRTIERIGNSQRISDRLLAIYYSEHGIHLGDAYAIANRELAARDDILTEDTLAWAAAQDGKWDVARSEMRKAMRFDTEFPIMQYHAGVIAEHFGDRAQARARLAKALAENPQFHPFYADDARSRLAALGGP